ncbi:MAG TPA: SIS domain-containing protein [Anaerolineales bacterium]|nr:SIS domain-containing protein [Anaerolineales bacterium]
MQAFIDNYLKELSQVIDHISREDVNAVAEALLAARDADKTIFIIGDGGSASTASHMMCDINKFTLVPGQKRFRAHALTDNMALVTAWGNDTSFDNTFAEPLRNLLRPGDVVVAISTSGNSPNVIKAVEMAKNEFNAQIIGWVGDKGGKLVGLSDLVVRIPSPFIGQQEDGHLILNHVIANALRDHLLK